MMLNNVYLNRVPQNLCTVLKIVLYDQDTRSENHAKEGLPENNTKQCPVPVLKCTWYVWKLCQRIHEWYMSEICAKDSAYKLFLKLVQSICIECLFENGAKITVNIYFKIVAKNQYTSCSWKRCQRISVQGLPENGAKDSVSKVCLKIVPKNQCTTSFWQ